MGPKRVLVLVLVGLVVLMLVIAAEKGVATLVATTPTIARKEAAATVAKTAILSKSTKLIKLVSQRRLRRSRRKK